MREQAEFYASQGSLLRAAAIYRRLVASDPSAENLLALADVYMRQGLEADSVALHMMAMGLTPTITTDLMAQMVAPAAVATTLVN